MYVDLNVIRAGRAQSLEDSDHTSIQDRIEAHQHLGTLMHGQRRRTERMNAMLPHLSPMRRPRHREDGIWLAPIKIRVGQTARRGLLGMSIDQYLKLVDATGRIVRGDKRGSIPPEVTPILQRLQVEERRWIETMRHLGRLIGSAVGSATSLAREAARRGVARVMSAMDVYDPHPPEP